MLNANTRDALFSLSVANLAYTRIWHELIFQHVRPLTRYLVQNPATPLDYVAVMINVLIMAAILYLICRVIRTTHSGLLRNALIAVVSIVCVVGILWVLRIFQFLGSDTIFAIKYFIQERPFIFAVMFTSCLGVFYFFLIQSGFAGAIRRGIVILFLVLSPFCLSTFGQAIYLAVVQPYQEEFREQSSPAISATLPEKRVVVLLFDELDYRLVFAERPAGVSLPEFDRFAAVSLSADSATSPSNSTTYTIPALLTGRMLDKEEIVGANNLQLIGRESGERVSWSLAPTIFSHVRELGGNSGLAGWWHPYQRIVKKDLAVCDVYYMENLTRDDATSVVHKMLNQYLTITAFPTLVSNKSLNLAMYPAILQQSVDLAVDPRFQMVFVHYPYPHAPYVFNVERSHIELMRPDHANYLGNLALSDRTLGMIRQHMDVGGLWEKSMVVVTSDHWWRRSKEYDGREDYRIPFMVKLPGQAHGHIYSKKFNTIVMKSMIEAFFDNAFADGDSLASWLDLNAHAINPVFRQQH